MTRRSFRLVSSLLLCASLSARALAQAPAEDVEIEIEAAPPPKAPAPSTPKTPVVAPAAPSQGALGQAPATSIPSEQLPVSEPPAATREEVEALRAELAALSQRLSESETARAKAGEQAEAERAEAERARAEEHARSLRERIAKLGVSVSGYVQLQYGQSQLSQDELLQGGTPLNQDRFSVRRGRLRLKGRWKYAKADFEVDASTTRGPTASVRRALVGGVLPSASEGAPPLLVLSVGLMEIPLGLELQQRQDEILFLERTLGSLSFFPGPVDTGLRLDAALGPFRAQLAVMNGAPLDDRAGGPSGIDPTRAPDFIGRLGFDSGDAPERVWRLAGGASFLSGTGFHPGSDATKPVLQWDDSNGDGAINAGELVAVAGRGALPSKTFDRWAVAADLDLDFETALGWSRVYGEVVLATNLDRALYVADPIAAGDDVREVSWYVALIQDLTEWGFVGLRYDVYDPNSDLIDNRRGQSVPADATLKTISPIAGARWPGYGRLTFEYDVIKDKLARDTRGVPTDVANNQWTLRVQGEF